MAPAATPGAAIANIENTAAAAAGIGSPNRTMTVRGRVETKDEVAFPDLLLQFVQHDRWLNTHQLLLRIDLNDAAHTFGAIDDGGSVAALPGHTGPNATCVFGAPNFRKAAMVARRQRDRVGRQRQSGSAGNSNCRSSNARDRSH